MTSLNVTGFQTVNGVLQADGTATGTITSATGAVTNFTSAFTSNLTTTSGTYPILRLTLGPINLDLLGLVITTNQINLNITAVSGPGDLLGNLLCAVTNLLNNNGALNTLLNQIAGLLNQLLPAGGLTL